MSVMKQTTPNLTTPLAGGMIHRPAAERGMANHGWLKSAHSFSFSGYHDPAHMQFESLRVINEDEVAAGEGFGAHPHRDTEIFSYVLEGALAHQDSMGNGSTVTAGGVQFMSAGSGVQHSEFNHSATERVRFLQIWLLPNVTGGEPRYETQQISDADKDGRLYLFLSGDGRESSIHINANADIYAATLHAKQEIDYVLQGGRRGWIQLARGELSVNGQRLAEGDGLAITESGLIQFTNGVNAEIIFFDLEAL